MKKIKVAEATEIQIDCLVAKCEGLSVSIPAFADTPWLRVRDERGFEYRCPRYSTDWAQAGPIMFRELIGTTPSTEHEGLWLASTSYEGEKYAAEGDTPLIAAMRCFVVSKLGPEVDIPDALVQAAPERSASPRERG